LLNDAHEGHAFFALYYSCEACKKILEENFEEKPQSNAWYRRLATLAKERNWFVPPAEPDGRMDVMSAWCLDCATRLGLTTDWLANRPSGYETV
jgi:hypothetical protein